MTIWEALSGLGEIGAILATGMMLGTENYWYAAGLIVVSALLGAIHLTVRDKRVKRETLTQVKQMLRA